MIRHSPTQGVVANESQQDFANPGDRPYTVTLPQRTARYVRVTAEKLWPRTNDFVFALAELQVESGGRNAAAGAAVSALDSIEGGRWSKQNLVDGFASRRVADMRRPTWHSIAGGNRAIWQAAAERTGRADERVRGRQRCVPDLPNSTSKWRRSPRTRSFMRSNRSNRGRFTCCGGRKEPASSSGRVPSHARRPGSRILLTDPQNEGAPAALAHWIVDPANVLTRRSIVNRVWQYHFGAGLVDTPNDFGRMGSHLRIRSCSIGWPSSSSSKASR